MSKNNMSEVYMDAMDEHFELAAKPHYFPTYFWHPADDQPERYAWFHVWCSDGPYATEKTISLEFCDAEEFHSRIVEAVKSFFSPEALELIRQGKIKNFGMQIGPEQPSGGNVNDELGLEVHYGKE